MRSKPVSTTKRARLLGPGTVLAIIAAIGILVYGRLGERTSPDPNTGQIAYEADGLGRMRETKAAMTPQVKPPPLLKPEVALLVQHAPDLRLNSRQKAQIEALNAAWKQEKTGIEAALRGALSEADGKRKEAQTYHSTSASQITASLGDYSRLSHQFNDRRASYWMQALAVLTPEQKTTLERIMSTDGKGRTG